MLIYYEEQQSNRFNYYCYIVFSEDAGDHILEDHLMNAKKNVTYVSNTVQNELIHIIGCHILEKIVLDVNACGSYFSIQGDELQDISNQEQLTTCIRYISKDGNILIFLFNYNLLAFY